MKDDLRVKAKQEHRGASHLVYGRERSGRHCQRARYGDDISVCSLKGSGFYTAYDGQHFGRGNLFHWPDADIRENVFFEPGQDGFCMTVSPFFPESVVLFPRHNLKAAFPASLSFLFLPEYSRVNPCCNLFSYLVTVLSGLGQRDCGIFAPRKRVLFLDKDGAQLPPLLAARLNNEPQATAISQGIGFVFGFGVFC